LKNKPTLDANVGTNTQQSIETDIIDHFQRHAPPLVLLVNVVLACCLVAVMWRWTGHPVLLAWLCTQTLITIGNGLLYRSFRLRIERKRTKQNSYWYKWFCAGAVANGISWGLATSWFYTPDAHLQSIFMILIAAGLAAGVASVQTSLRAGFMAFVAPALLLPALIISARFGAEEYVPSALLVLYFCAVTYIGFNNRRTIIETILLKFEKDQLLAQINGSERYFRALIENASDLVMVVDVNGKIIFQSPSSRHVVGFRPEELLGLCLFDFIHSDDVHGLRSTLQYLRKYPGVTTGGETRWRHRNGHWLVLEGNGRALDIDPDLIVINARDVTERRAMETELRDAKIKAETANQTKSLFLANMSHEIRTPMHAILAMADVLGETSLSADQTRHVSAFKNAGEQLLHLLNDVLDFSRIETGELKLGNTSFHLPRLVESVSDLMWSQAKNKQITLRCEIDPVLKPWRLGDPQRLRQVVVNLVNNAIKFTESGEVIIRLSSLRGDRVVMAVIDTGEGIPEEQQSLIFESFVQANSSIGERFGGAGLGLSICKRLVQAMDGQITVQSQLGKGSVFSCELRLPIIDEPAESMNQRERHSVLIAAKLPPAHILVADDSVMNRMVVEEYLRYTACTIDFAVNGQEAIEQLIHKPCDLVLMDLRMPVMDGLTATRLIRRREQEQRRKSVPIIALTAGMLNNEREAALEAGCSDFLAKPVGRDELMQVLAKFLQKENKNIECEALA